MAEASKLDILDQIAATLRAAFEDELGTDNHAIQVVSRMLVNPTGVLACVDMFPAASAEGTEALAFGDLEGEHIYTIRARTTQFDDAASQDILLRLQDGPDALCIPGILDEDETLNGLVSSLYMHDRSGFQLFPPGDLVGFTWNATVNPGIS